ncbi:hypothetical protein WJX72_000800 [[Myrmecia] bisecta]|uniref:Uncharacterized protein n=1 Tax=[Myrmecia] bisecta TaxID=41462 RepID=A0AAW1R4K3_9CHLO
MKCSGGDQLLGQAPRMRIELYQNNTTELDAQVRQCKDWKNIAFTDIEAVGATPGRLMRDEAMRQSGVTGPLGVGMVMQSIALPAGQAAQESDRPPLAPRDNNLARTSAQVSHKPAKNPLAPQEVRKAQEDPEFRVWDSVPLAGDKRAYAPSESESLTSYGQGSRVSRITYPTVDIPVASQKAAPKPAAKATAPAPPPPPPPPPPGGPIRPQNVPALPLSTLTQQQEAVVQKATAPQPQAGAQKPKDASGAAADAYELEDLDDEWISLLNELDDRFYQIGRPTMDSNERAVAIRSLLVSTASEKPEVALHKAIDDIERFRRVKR